MPSSLAGCFEEVADLGAAVVEEGCKEVVVAQKDFYASWIRRE
jgi:hypothetical protein